MCDAKIFDHEPSSSSPLFTRFLWRRFDGDLLMSVHLNKERKQKHTHEQETVAGGERPASSAHNDSWNAGMLGTKRDFQSAWTSEPTHVSSHWSTSAAFTASVVFKGYKWGYAYRLQRLQMGVRIPAPKGTRRSSMTSSQKLHQAFRRCRENLHFQVVRNSVKSKKRCFAFSELNICKYKNYCLRMNFTWSVVDGTDEDKTSTKRKRHMTLNQSGVTSYVTTYVSVPVGVSRGRRFR